MTLAVALPSWLCWDRRRVRLRGAWPVWLESLGEVRRELAEINQITEQDFLQVGEKLQRFLEVSGQISDQCSHLVGFLSGEEADRGANDLHSILERARAMARQAGTNRLALDRMLEGVGHITAPLADLTAEMRSFRVMATLIRIEGARLNQAGVDFETLAEDVRKLAADIEENGRTVLSASRELRGIMRLAAAGIGEFEARQEMELPRIEAQAGASLAALGERRARAAKTSGEMGSCYEAVRRDIGDLVTSLQFHDITRQQVEHVAAALEQAEEEIPADSAGLLVRLCELQRAQLGQSKEAFLAAVTRVRESLAGISRHVSQMAAESTNMLGGAIGKDDSFLGEMEQGFTGIRTAVAEYAESRYALSTVADTVAQGVREMAGFVETIEGIGIRMQRLALNANIKAIRIGGQGVALGSVADGIQKLAADCTGHTEVVTEGIRVVTDGSAGLSAALAVSGADLAGELEQVIAFFHAADGESRRRLAEIGELGRTFSREIERLCGGIQADELLATAVERSCARLERIVTAAGPLATAHPDAAETVIMHKLEARYTMHAERAVHQQGTLEEQPVAVPGEWGDNVELF